MREILLSCCLSLIVSTSMISQNVWYTQTSGTNKFLTDVHFADQNNGWITGWTGTILHTTDGGEIWTPLSPPSTNAYETIFFIDEMEGWAAGYAGILIHTTDGGSTWNEQLSGTDYSIYDIQFYNNNTGWMVSSRFESFTTDPARRIHGTTDGGNTWTILFGENDEPPLLALHFPSLSTGFAVGEKGTILRTTDGGINWVELMYDNMYHFRDVFFIDDDHGWVVGEDLSLDHKAVIFNTSNGGDSWSLQTFDNDQSLSGVFFVSPEEGWAVGGGTELGGVILYTDSGGQNWEYQDNGGALALASVFFADEELGWAVGYDGTIVHTDGTAISLSENMLNELNGLAVRTYPNPFSSDVCLEYYLDAPQNVIITIFDGFGRSIEEFNDVQDEGNQKYTWKPNEIPDGLYFYSVRTSKATSNGKILRAK